MASQPILKGRGASYNPPNRYESLALETEVDSIGEKPATRFFIDRSKAILARNDSPDVSFTYSLNPYRGCEHGCIYCYARPTHEQLGFSAGLEFETRIMIKREAPKLLEKVFQSRHWQPQPVGLSGNTDCYQPVEAELGLTRACLEVFLRYRNPVTIITKNALVLRDLDLLRELARLNLVCVALSITTLNNRLSRIMEPRTSAPQKRLEAIKRLSQEGIPTGVMVAPVIPALNESEIPAILQNSATSGARWASYILLRLPHGVKELFVHWLETHFPERKAKIVHALESMRQGKLYCSEFGERQRGSGPRARMIQQLFTMWQKRLGLDRHVELTTERFTSCPQQGDLFK